MKLNWLKDIDVGEISYVDRPAIDKRFIAIKRVADDTPKEKEESKKTFIEKVKESFSGQKAGRVLNKSNEDRLVELAETLSNASDMLKSVLSTVKQNKEGEDMEKDEVKEIVEEVINAKVDALKTELSEKFVVKEVEKPEDNKEEKAVEEKVDVAKVIADAVTAVSEKFATEIKSIKDEIHAKPESDKKDINNGEKKEDVESEDFTGSFGLKMF